MARRLLLPHALWECEIQGQWKLSVGHLSMITELLVFKSNPITCIAQKSNFELLETSRETLCTGDNQMSLYSAISNLAVSFFPFTAIHIYMLKFLDLVTSEST